MRASGWQYVPVNVPEGADIVRVGRTEDQIPERAACDASSTGLPPMLQVFGLLGSSQVAAVRSVLTRLSPARTS